MYSFGSGVLYGVNSVANSTPVRFGGLQDVSIEFSHNIKELYGQNQFPLAIGRGQGKVTGKAKAATINGNAFNQIFFGQTLNTGETEAIVDETGTIPDTPGPYTVTVAQSATWLTDLGVTFSATGLALVKVASSPSTGQYSVAAGVYTFAAADKLLGVKISYTYTSNSNGKNIVIANQLLGTTPVFQATFTSVYLTKRVTFVLNKCTSSKLSFASKLEDFVIPEFDFACFADDSGNIGTLSFDE